MYFDIPRQIMISTWHDYQTSTMIHMCSKTIVYHLMKNGLVLTKNSKRITPSLAISDALEVYWGPFVEGLVDQVMAFGFAVVMFQKDGADCVYPTTVDPHLYTIAVEIINNNMSFKLSSTELDMESVMVYNHFGFSPVVRNGRGMLTSLAWKVIPPIRFLNNVRNACETMEANKTRPQFFTEQQPTSRERQEGVDFDYYAEADSSEIREDMQFQRNASNIRILEQQKDLYNTYMNRKESSSHPYNRGIQRVVNKLDDIVQLPEGHHVVATPQNTGRQDVVQMHKIIQEEICSTLGVPRALLISDSMYKSSTEGIEEFFSQTVAWWSRKLQILLTDVYTKIYFNKKMGKLKNIYTAKQRHQIQVHFDYNTTIKEETLQNMYNNGILTWDAYSKTMIKMAGMAEEDRNLEPPALHGVDASEVVTVSNKRKRTAGGLDDGT